jgi:membrane-bound inhibitor of C-type lysozyme
MGAKPTLAIMSMLLASACLGGQSPQTAATTIQRPAPEDPTPSGISYICEGRKQVTVVYAKLRASVTVDGRTWRLEYQPTESGFRYFDVQHEWIGTDSLASLRTTAQRVPVAFNCRPTARI